MFSGKIGAGLQDLWMWRKNAPLTDCIRISIRMRNA